MSAENKALAEQMLQAWNEGDFARIEELFAPDYVNHNPPPFPGATGDLRSQLMAMRALREGFPDARAETVQVIAEGDKVVLHDVVRGTHEGEFMGVAPTGNEVRVDFIHIFRVSEGKLAERWGVIDAMSLMRQIGAVPAPAGA